jgi:hypothetical protein
MFQRRLFLILILGLLLWQDVWGFVVLIPGSSTSVAKTKAFDLLGATRILGTSALLPKSALHMSNTTPSVRPPNTNDSLLALTAVLLALLVTMTDPLPLLNTSVFQHHDHQHRGGGGLQSSSHIISKLEVTPLGGGGFGGMGFGPGFMPIPFGGFGFGFTVKNRPPPPTEQQLLEASQRELQNVKQYEKTLQSQINTMEQQQQQQQQQSGGGVQMSVDKN